MLNKIFANEPVTIFTVMSAMANEHGAINLGQGFPDGNGPDWIRKAAAEAIVDGPNQYPPMAGLPELRQAVAQQNKRFYGLDVDWESEVIVTSGATEALADCFLALINPGDEVVIIEPAYDSYAPFIRALGATPVFVQLSPPDWHMNEQALRQAFSEKTKLIVINTPMNPTGKVFSSAELSLIADLLIEYDAYAVCDEVYEHLIFEDHKHIPIMALPDMYERCIRIGSAGKTFSLTGWKIGYITAAKQNAEVIAKAHQYTTFTTVPALQKAIAEGLNTENQYFDALAGDMQGMRDFLRQGLEQLGFNLLPCHGTYFLTADFSSFDFSGSDISFCEYLTKEAGVAAIPVSVFYDPGSLDIPTNLIRFCFCKDKQILEQALERLRRFFSA